MLLRPNSLRAVFISVIVVIVKYWYPEDLNPSISLILFCSLIEQQLARIATKFRPAPYLNAQDEMIGDDRSDKQLWLNRQLVSTC